MGLNKCLMGFPSPRHPGQREREEAEGRNGAGLVDGGGRPLTRAGVARLREQHPSAHGLDVVGRRGAAHAGAALSGARPSQAAAGAGGIGVEAVSPG